MNNKLKIDKQHIINGTPNQINACPIAIALNEWLQENEKAEVSTSYTVITISNSDPEYLDDLITLWHDKKLANWIENYDSKCSAPTIQIDRQMEKLKYSSEYTSDYQSLNRQWQRLYDALSNDIYENSKHAL